MGGYRTKESNIERAVLVGVVTPKQSYSQASEYIEELAFLAKTAGVYPVKTFLQNLSYSRKVPIVS